MRALCLQMLRSIVLMGAGLSLLAGAKAQRPETAPSTLAPGTNPPTPQSATADADSQAMQGRGGASPLVVAAAKKAAPPLQSEGKKSGYTGPTTLVELPPTPMLDEEGNQRLDPDGKPLFNAPVHQQRDKKGHPLFDEAGKPVMQTATELGYDEHGKKLHVEKVKPPKALPVSISRGTLTVDGMTAKAALNYDIADLKYIYLSAPGVGIAVVSPEPFSGATAQARGFDGNTLLVRVGEHTLELTSDKPILGKEPRAAYVLLDRNFALPLAAPVMGYGSLRKAPYAWPGARPNATLAGAAVPPIPENMRPTQLLGPCPKGQMRRSGVRTQPGKPVPEASCVPIAPGKTPPVFTPAEASASQP